MLLRIVETTNRTYDLVPTGRDLPQEAQTIAEGELVPGVSFTFSLFRYGAKGPFRTPRHRHSFEQVRYVVDGVANISPATHLPAGHVAFFPAGAYYGPQDDSGSTVMHFKYGKNT